MGLTSGWFLAVVIGAAIGWIAATVLVWPYLAGLHLAGPPQPPKKSPSKAAHLPATTRLVGRMAGRMAGQAGMLIGSQILVIAAVLVWLNSYFAFYGSWSELFGHGAAVKNAAQARQAKSAKAAIAAKAPSPVGPGLKAPGDAPPAPPVGAPSRWHAESVLFYGFGLGPGPGQPGLPPHSQGPAVRQLTVLPGAARYGMLTRIQIKGLRSGLTASSGYVYLPPQYFQPTYAHARFPAVLALTGYPGGARSIIDRLGLPLTAARLTAKGRARPVVYVMLNVSPVFPRDTECTNVPAGPQVATFFAVDVPLAIEQALRVTTRRAGWGTLGYSTGGYCAAKLAMLYPDTFSAAVSIAGYYVALHDSTTGNIYGSSRAYRNENNLDWRLLHLPAPPISLLVTSSKVGENTYPGTVRFLHLIRLPMHVYALIHPVGGHNFSVWSHELPQTLRWLTFRLGHPGSAAGSPAGATSRLAAGPLGPPARTRRAN